MHVMVTLPWELDDAGAHELLEQEVDARVDAVATTATVWAIERAPGRTVVCARVRVPGGGSNL